MNTRQTEITQRKWEKIIVQSLLQEGAIEMKPNLYDLE